MNKPVDSKSYSEYLKKRSMLGLLYRHRFLYPRLAEFIQGEVLDFGCGIGDFLKFFPGAVGVDVNETNIAYCRARGLDARLIEDKKAPFSDGVFDSVVMDNVLEHVTEAEADAVLQDIMRILRPHGIMVVGVPGRKGFACDPDHKVFYDENKLCHLMDRHGCECKEVFRMPLSFPSLGRILRQYCVYGVFAKGD